ncbi:DUF3634 family protein [Salinisphaera sp. Q1T1-3]|uniref:DUF3634 family protein n=1 Tax=Salinisphaera sp. Q1T1-3 TaxID=2321229 RepID=UPI00131430D1|nr:DUF3634 family protein [Salinisphaera sp. Q1T1-3]
MFDRFRLNYRLVIDDVGQVRVDVGRAPPRFLHDVVDITRLHGIDRGSIECKGAGARTRLRFSNDFPRTGRQAVRNVWQPPSGPGPSGGRRAAG